MYEMMRDITYTNVFAPSRFMGLGQSERITEVSCQLTVSENYVLNQQSELESRVKAGSRLT